jgi:hypothetical protein
MNTVTVCLQFSTAGIVSSMPYLLPLHLCYNVKPLLPLVHLTVQMCVPWLFGDNCGSALG